MQLLSSWFAAYSIHRRVNASLNFCQSFLLQVFVIQSCLASFFMSPDHLVCGLPLLLLFSHGLYFITFRVHLLHFPFFIILVSSYSSSKESFKFILFSSSHRLRSLSFSWFSFGGVIDASCLTISYGVGVRIVAF